MRSLNCQQEARVTLLHELEYFKFVLIWRRAICPPHSACSDGLMCFRSPECLKVMSLLETSTVCTVHKPVRLTGPHIRAAHQAGFTENKRSELVKMKILAMLVSVVLSSSLILCATVKTQQLPFQPILVQ